MNLLATSQCCPAGPAPRPMPPPKRRWYIAASRDAPLSSQSENRLNFSILCASFFAEIRPRASACALSLPGAACLAKGRGGARGCPRDTSSSHARGIRIAQQDRVDDAVLLLHRIGSGTYMRRVPLRASILMRETNPHQISESNLGKHLFIEASMMA